MNKDFFRFFFWGGGGEGDKRGEKVIERKKGKNSLFLQQQQNSSRLNVLRFHASAERKQALRDFGRGKRAVDSLRAEGVDVILTTYPLFESSGADAREARHWLTKIPLGVVALDEAHAIKAGAAVSARARRLGELGARAAMRVFLTGTPLQNKLGELKTLLAFLLPGFDWEQLADDEEDDDDEEEEGGEKGRKGASRRSFEQAARLRKALAPFCLRRLKSEVAKQLPPKTREDVSLELPEGQRRAYDAALRAFAAKINAKRSDDDGRDDNGGDNGSTAEIETDREEALRLLRSMPAKALASSFTHLRKLANQPLLVRGGHYFDDAKVEELARASAALGLFGDGAGMSTPPGAKPGRVPTEALCWPGSGRSFLAILIWICTTWRYLAASGQSTCVSPTTRRSATLRNPCTSQSSSRSLNPREAASSSSRSGWAASTSWACCSILCNWVGLGSTGRRRSRRGWPSSTNSTALLLLLLRLLLLLARTRRTPLNLPHSRCSSRPKRGTGAEPDRSRHCGVSRRRVQPQRRAARGGQGAPPGTDAARSSLSVGLEGHSGRRDRGAGEEEGRPG